MQKLHIYLFSAFLFAAATSAQAQDDEAFDQLDVLNIEDMEKRIMDRHLEEMTKPQVARPIPQKVPKPAKGTPTKTQRKNKGMIDINEIADNKNPNTVINRSGLYE